MLPCTICSMAQLPVGSKVANMLLYSILLGLVQLYILIYFYRNTHYAGMTGGCPASVLVHKCPSLGTKQQAS